MSNRLYLMKTKIIKYGVPREVGHNMKADEGNSKKNEIFCPQ